MGQDTAGITIIGVKIELSKFGDVTKASCGCESIEPFLCSPECGSQMDTREDLAAEINCVLRDGEIYDSKLGQYETYREYYSNRLVNGDYFYICIYKGEKWNPDSGDIKFSSFENLLLKRDELKEYLFRLNLMTDQEFSDNFGINELLEIRKINKNIFIFKKII